MNGKLVEEHRRFLNDNFALRKRDSPEQHLSRASPLAEPRTMTRGKTACPSQHTEAYWVPDLAP